jgi:hypothetical protein
MLVPSYPPTPCIKVSPFCITSTAFFLEFSLSPIPIELIVPEFDLLYLPSACSELFSVIVQEPSA